MGQNAGKGAVRCKAIDARGLAAMESHGKRLDKSSARRIVRDDDPLVFKGLDLAALYEAHMRDVRQNKAAKKTTLHFIVRFPPELLEGPEVGKFSGSRKKRQQMMMIQAIAFVNRTHGGDAVYAARVDRDEAGESIVDVFAAPKYEKRTKRTKADEVGDVWASATKFGRDLTEKHQQEIQTRHPKAKGMLQGPRMVGIALQSEFASFFREINGVPLAPKLMKKTFLEDRLEIEAYKEIQAARDEIKSDRADLKADQDRFSEDQSQLYQDRADLEEDRKDLESRELILGRHVTLLTSALDTLRRAVSVIRGKLGLSIGDDLTDDLAEIGDAVRDLSRPSEEPVDDARPSL
jgi:hypothetical protein